MKIKQFLEIVTSQIRSKQAKAYVSEELTQHILRSKKLWLQKGINEIEAEEKAIHEMGSPLTLGQSLDHIHKPKIDWLLISILCCTLLLSFLPLLTYKQEQYSSYIDLQTMIQNKVIFVILGLFLALAIMYADYRKLQRFSYLFYVAGIGFLSLLHFFSNTLINGEVMLSIGMLDLQIWMAIPLFLIAWAAIFARPSVKILQAMILFVISIISFASVANLSVLFMYVVLVGVLFSQSQVIPRVKLLVISATGILAIGVVILTTSILHQYQLHRLYGYLNHQENAEGAGYMYLLLEEVIKNAAWFGSKTQVKIPGAHTDLVFGHLIQSYGYGLALIIVILLSVFVIRLCIISFSIKDSFGKLLVIGGVTLFSIQFIYTIGMSVGILPIVSMPLPFMSYGFMPTILNAFIVGIALSVYRRKSLIQIKRKSV